MQGNAGKVDTINDREEYKILREAFRQLRFSNEEVEVSASCVCLHPPL